MIAHAHAETAGQGDAHFHQMVSDYEIGNSPLISGIELLNFTSGRDNEALAKVCLIGTRSGKVRDKTKAAIRALAETPADLPPGPLPEAAKQIADVLFKNGLTHDDILLIASKPDDPG